MLLLAADPAVGLLATVAEVGPPLLWRAAGLSLLGPVHGLDQHLSCTAMAWLR